MLATLTWDTFSSIQVHPGFQALVASGQEHHGQRRSQRNDKVHSPCPLCFLADVFLNSHIVPSNVTHQIRLVKMIRHLNLQAEREFTY